MLVPVLPPTVPQVVRLDYTMVAPPMVTNATVYCQWDATVTANMSGPITLQVDTWRPVVGPPGLYMVRFGPSSELQPKFRRGRDGRGGMYLETGTVMTTVTPFPQQLYGRAVFVVATMHAQATPTIRTVLGHRQFPLDAVGSMILRMDVSRKMTSYWCVPPHNWQTVEYGSTPVVPEQRQVWGFQ